MKVKNCEEIWISSNPEIQFSLNRPTGFGIPSPPLFLPSDIPP